MIHGVYNYTKEKNNVDDERVADLLTEWQHGHWALCYCMILVLFYFGRQKNNPSCSSYKSCPYSCSSLPAGVFHNSNQWIYLVSLLYLFDRRFVIERREMFVKAQKQ